MSMWEPRSSHLYVWTGLRVCEWLRVGAGTPCLCPRCGQSGAGRAHQWCVCVCVCSMHMVCGHAPLPLSTRACLCVSKVCGPARSLSVWPGSGHVPAWLCLSRRQLCAATHGPQGGRVWAPAGAPLTVCSCARTGTCGEGVGG